MVFDSVGGHSSVVLTFRFGATFCVLLFFSLSCKSLLLGGRIRQAKSLLHRGPMGITVERLSVVVGRSTWISVIFDRSTKNAGVGWNCSILTEEPGTRRSKESGSHSDAATHGIGTDVATRFLPSAICVRRGLVMTATILNWWQKFLTQRRANKVASAALEECWRKVQVKAAVLPPDVDDYIRKHSAAAVSRTR